MQTRQIIMIVALIVALSLVSYAAFDRGQDSVPPQPLAKVIDVSTHHSPAAPDPDPDTVVTKPDALILTPGMTSEEIFAELDRAYQSQMSPEEIEARKNPQAGDIFTMHNGGKCTVVVQHRLNKNGTTRRLISCEPNQPREPRPHEQYDNATLEAMAYADAGAAYELGRRLSEESPLKARELMLRSVALDPDNMGPLHWISGQNYGLRTHNGVPVVADIEQSYILLGVAAEMTGVGSSLLPTARGMLIDGGYSDQDFLKIHSAIAQEMQSIRKIQIEVTGQTTVTPL